MRQKQRLSLMLVVMMVMSFFPVGIFATDGGVGINNFELAEGDVTTEAAISLLEHSKTLDGLDGIEFDEVNGYRLTKDITLLGWEPIDFEGTLDGDGYTITLNGQPLFGDIKGTVKNLLLDGSVESTEEVGALAYTMSAGYIQNVWSGASVTGTSSENVGGLVGQVTGGEFQGCLVTGELTPGSGGTAYGMAATGGKGEFHNCYWTGTPKNAAQGGTKTHTKPIASDKEAYINVQETLNAFAATMEGLKGWEIDSSSGIPKPTGVFPGDSTVVDKTELNIVLKTQSDYEEYQDAIEKFNAYESVLEKAKQINEASDVTQLQVITIITDLNKAYEELLIHFHHNKLTKFIDEIDHAIFEEFTLDYEEHTQESWDKFSSALGKAKMLYELSDYNPPTPSELEDAFTNLSEAKQALVKLEWVEIRTASELSSIDGTKLYRLMSDITNYTSHTDITLGGKFDGNGHTISFAQDAKPLFTTIAKSGRVYNLGLSGEVSGTGAFAAVLQGQIHNSYSWVNVKGGDQPAGGLVGKIEGDNAQITNTYVTGTTTGTSSGAIIGEIQDQKAIDLGRTYWLNGDNAIGNKASTSQNKMTLTQLQSEAFANTLNRDLGKRNTPKTWNRNEEGLPYFGEELAPQDYFYPVVMADLVDKSIQTITSRSQVLTTDIFGGPDGYVAELSLPDYILDDTGEIEWDTNYEGAGNSPIIVAESTGKVFVRGPGSVTVTAYEITDNDETEIQSFTLKANMPEEFDFKLKLDNEDYTGKTYQMTGSQDLGIRPFVSKRGGEFNQAYSSLFKWSSDQESVINVSSLGDITVKKEGSATITVSIGNLEKTIKIQSSYVPIEGIQGNFEDVYYIHSRNPNSIGQNNTPGIASFALLGDIANRNFATITPENATHAKDYDIHSSDSSIVDKMLPFKEGAATLTVKTRDLGLTTQFSDTAKIEIKYFNPLESLTVKNNDIEVKTGEVIDANLVFKGPKSDEGYHVTESNMIWKQIGGTGEVSAYRSYPVIMINDEAGSVKEGTVSNDQWLLRGVKEGPVTLVGTPADSNNGAEPITLNINVLKGDLVDKKPGAQRVSAALNQAATYQLANMPNPVFGSEWGILGLARADYPVPENFYETYYASAYQRARKEEDKTSNRWDNKVTEAQRLALALTAIGKDPRDVNGVNLLDYSWNKAANFPGLQGSSVLGDRQGSNELIYALLAVEANKAFKRPDDAVVTIDSMIDKLFADFQDSEGGFGLYGKTYSVDITAMAIQALAKHYDEPRVKEAVNKAIAKLSTTQGVDGTYGTSEATSQVILALAEMGIDPDTDQRFIKGGFSLLDGLLAYVKEDGSFSHVMGGDTNPMATEQALYSLAGLDRFYKGQGRLYNMNDVKIEGEISGTDVTNITVFPKEESLQVGKTSQLTATILPVTATNKLVSWATSNKDVARVNDSGLVTAVAEGTATITVTSKDSGLTAQGIIKVVAPPTRPDEKLTVTLSVDKKTIGKGHVIYPRAVEIAYGDSVWDVLQEVLDAQGISYHYSDNAQYGSVYIESIDGDGEFDHGPGSGWKYNVDGTYPDHGASVHKLYGGETIQWRYTTNLGKDLDGDDMGGAGGVKDPVEEIPKEGEGDLPEDLEKELEEEITPEAVVDKDGNASVTVSNEAINKALEETVKNNSNNIVLRPMIKGESKSASIQVTNNAISEISKKGKSLKVETPLGSISLKADALKDLSAMNGKDIAFTSRSLANGAVEFAVTIDGKSVSKLKGGIKAEMPEKNTKGKVLVLIAEDGTETIIKKTALTKDGLTAILAGSASIKVSDNSKSFKDVEDNHWATSTIDFVSSRELFGGTSKDIFSANEPMTRSMFVTVLHRLEDNKKSGKSEKFDDVSEDSWYAKSVAWAAGEGIIAGTGNGFSPNDSISREQLATMLYRYSQYLDLDQESKGDLSQYKDQVQVSDWASETVSWAVGAGLLRGKNENRLDPKGFATRAEVATMTMRMVEMIVK